MRKIRILQVSFDTEIKPYELPAFRGAVAHKVGLEHHWFHNHDNENGGTFNRYPLIQYKLDTYKGQMRPMLLCLEQGIEEAQHLFSQPEWSLNIKGTHHDLRIARLDVKQYTVQVWDRPFEYRLHKWQALGIDNYKEWKNLEGLVAKIQFLEKRLSNHIISFASGIDCRLEKPFKVEIIQIKEPEWISFKNIKVLAFTLDFKTNISMPDYIGLGKGSSRGLGVLRRFPNERTDTGLI